MVDIQNLSFHYPGKPPVLDQVNLSLRPGHIYGLLGRNGAGKSTLLKNMVGLAFAQTGQCLLAGQPAARRLPAVLERVYFLPEETYAPPVTARQFVARTACFYPRFSHAELGEYLRVLDVPSECVLGQLSFGQQKKFMIAFGLATNCELLIMDEPTNGLDIPAKTQFSRLIASVLTPHRCLLISTHQVRDLEQLIDRVIVLHQRRILLDADLATLSRRISCAQSPLDPAATTLYVQESARGRQALQVNHAGQPGQVDLELLFNAATDASGQLATYLQTPWHEQPV